MSVGDVQLWLRSRPAGLKLADAIIAALEPVLAANDVDGETWAALSEEQVRAHLKEMGVVPGVVLKLVPALVARLAVGGSAAAADGSGAADSHL